MLRWRVLSDEELDTIKDRGRPQFVCLFNTWQGGKQYAVLEESYGETSAEGTSWQAIDVNG
jgi:hypothetical protein